MGNDAVATKFVIFTNSSTRTGDGGVGTTTLRTDNGNLRIGTVGTLQFNLPTAPAVGQVLAATDTSGTVAWTTMGGGALSGVVYIGSSSVSTATQAFEIGGQRTGNGYAYVDLIGDATYTDFGFRMLRGDTGPNTWSVLDHRGTGDFQLRAVDAAPITFSTTNAERMRITAAGKVGIGTATPSAYGALTVAGDVFVGPVGSGGYGRRAYNTTLVSLQSNVYWNGTNNLSSVAGYSSLLDLRLDDGSIRFSTSASVAVNTALVMTERMRITASGNVGIGVTTVGAKLDVAGTLRLNGTTAGTNYTEIKAAASATAATYTLPSTVPSETGQVLSSDTSGNMSWTTPTSTVNFARTFFLMGA